MRKNSSTILFMLPKDFSSKVKTWGSSNVTDLMLPGIKHKGREKSPHVTLVTDLIAEEPDQLIQAVSNSNPFEIELGNITKFEKVSKGYDVLKIDVISSILQSLRNTLLANFEVKDPITPYHPHITIAYVRPFSCDHFLNNTSFKGLKVPLSSFVLSGPGSSGRFIDLASKKQSFFSAKALTVYACKNNISFDDLTTEGLDNLLIDIASNNIS